MFPFKIKTTPNVIFFDSSVQFVESTAVVQKTYKEKHMLEMKILEIHGRKEMQNIKQKKVLEKKRPISTQALSVQKWSGILHPPY